MAISVRNNNPGALMYAAWEKAYGAVPGGKNVAGTLARFPTPAQGYAAAAQWHRRAEAKGMVTLNQRMRVYAPPNGAGNSQASFRAYVKRLADSMGITPDTPFSIDDPNLGPKLLLAHAQFESGMQNPFPAGALEEGYKMAPGAVPKGGAPTEVAKAPTLRRGDYNPSVLDWQQTLAANDFSPGIGDSKFGRRTEAQTRAFQKANWLAADGVVGPQTRFAGNLGRDIRQGSIAAPLGAPMIGDMSTEAFGFGPRLPPAALFPSGGPVPPMNVGGPGRSPSGPAPQRPGRPFATPYMSDAGGEPITLGDVQVGDLTPVYRGNGPGRAPPGPAPLSMYPTLRTKDDAVSPPSSENYFTATQGTGEDRFAQFMREHGTPPAQPSANPFSNPQPWGAVADQSVDTLRDRLAAPRVPTSAPFGFAQAGGAGSVAMAPDATGGRNLALMGRAPVNMANAAGADNVTTPALLRDQQQANSFGNFLRSIYGGAAPAQASTPPAATLQSGASAAYGPRPAMPAINRPAPATISPQQFQQRFAPMGYSGIPADVTYRTASLSPVIANAASMAPKSITQAQFNGRFNPAPLSLAGAGGASPAYTYKTISVPGVSFAKPATVTPAGGESDVSGGVGLGASLVGAGGFGIGGVAEPPKAVPTMRQRLVRVAVPVAAAAALGPVGGILGRIGVNLAQRGPLAQRIGQAVAYANASPSSNAFSRSPFTPAGFTAPNYNPVSGGATYAYRTTAPGVGSYINSAGRTISYNVNDFDRVYGAGGGGLGGFQP